MTPWGWAEPDRWQPVSGSGFLRSDQPELSATAAANFLFARHFSASRKDGGREAEPHNWKVSKIRMKGEARKERRSRGRATVQRGRTCTRAMMGSLHLVTISQGPDQTGEICGCKRSCRNQTPLAEHAAASADKSLHPRSCPESFAKALALMGRGQRVARMCHGPPPPLRDAVPPTCPQTL